MQKYFLNIIILFCLANVLLAQQPIMELDSTTITEHDEVFLRLKILGGKDVSKIDARLEELRELEGIEIIEEYPWDSLNMNGDLVHEKKIKLTSRDSGFYWIPGIRLNYAADGKKFAKITEKIPLTVKPFAIASAEPRAIRDIKKEPFKFEDLIPLLIVLGIIASLGLGAYLYWKKRKGEGEEELPPKPVPAHEIALEKLKVLDDSKLWQQGKVKEYISQLTYIEREYLENRFEMQALESTTEEIIRDLKEKDISDAHRSELTEMFRMADMVKFAKAEPPATVHAKLMEQAEDFIRKTKKVVEDLIVEPQKDVS